MKRHSVYKNDGSIPVEEILCTTYQMRNFYTQMRDGFFSNLDVMNYIQHLVAVRMMKPNQTILDVCCGRSLLLPLMRYNAKTIKKYIGVDIEPKNIVADKKNICNGKDIDPKEHYPFETEWVISNVSEMSNHIKEKIDFCVYTSAIEHMHKEDGKKSILECSKIMKKGSTLFLSCPNTPENQDGFNVRYKAHVYEWKLSELRIELHNAGFTIINEYGLVGKTRTIKKKLTKLPESLQKIITTYFDYLPREFLTAFAYLPFPKLADEVLLIAKKRI